MAEAKCVDMEDKMRDRHVELSRRGFLSASLSGLVTVGLAGVSPGIARAQETTKTAASPDKKIIYRELGKTGMKLPIVSMGVANCNDPAIIQAAYKQGVRFFDTAPGYAYGRNEQMVGQVIKRLKARDKTFIATKVWTPAERRGKTAEDARKKIPALFEGSLRRLKTDYVDVLFLHDVSGVEPVREEGTRDALAKLKKQGKIRATGLTTHQGMAEIINQVAKGGFYDVVLTSFNVSMADDAELLAAIENAAKKGVGIIAMKTQAGGAQLPNRAALGQYSSSTINTASLKWAMRNENITTAIPGYTNLEHMQEDFSVAADLELTADEGKLLSDNNLKLGFGFCRQCKKCLASCPYNVDIPTLMRTHMYAAQYSDFHLARTALDAIPRANGLANCASCASCTVKCANQVNVPHKIEELKLIYT